VENRLWKVGITLIWKVVAVGILNSSDVKTSQVRQQTKTKLELYQPCPHSPGIFTKHIHFGSQRLSPPWVYSALAHARHQIVHISQTASAKLPSSGRCSYELLY